MTLTATVDELERALAEAGGTTDADLIRRIELLNALAWELSDSDASRALAFAETAYTLHGVDEVALVTALAEQIGMMLAAHQLRQHTRALAIIEERQRLARDMHDSISQTLYSLVLFAQTGREAAEDGDGERLAFSLDSLQQSSLQALRELRLLLYELRPADLQREGLVRALARRLDANVLKHAAARSVTLLLTQVGQEVRLQIGDDGRGFNIDDPRPGMGLRNISERVARLNGRLELSSRPGGGTRLEVVIPISAET